MSLRSQIVPNARFLCDMLLFAIVSVHIGVIISTKTPKHNTLAQVGLSVGLFCRTVIGVSCIGRLEYRRVRIRAMVVARRG